MLEETLQCLAPQPGETMLDGTLGLGGHAAEILRGLMPGGTLVGIDRDPRLSRGPQRGSMEWVESTVSCTGPSMRWAGCCGRLALGRMELSMDCFSTSGFPRCSWTGRSGASVFETMAHSI